MDLKKSFFVHPSVGGKTGHTTHYMYVLRRRLTSHTTCDGSAGFLHDMSPPSLVPLSVVSRRAGQARRFVSDANRASSFFCRSERSPRCRPQKTDIVSFLFIG